MWGHTLVSNLSFRNKTFAKSTKETLAVVVRNYAKADYVKCSDMAKFQLVFLLVSK